MKRSIAIALVLTLALSLAGCLSAEEKEALAAVTEMINKLENVTLEDAADVQKAQDSYDNLTDKAKEHVENYTVLESAHTQLASIVTEMISKIGEVTLDSEVAIDAAQEAYDLLPANAKTQVSNYSALENANAELFEVFTKTTNEVTDAIDKINIAMENLDTVSIYSLIPDTLPIAQKLAGSKYYAVGDVDPVVLMEDILGLMDDACYPNTHVLSLANYVKLAKLYSSAAGDDEDVINTDDKTGMDYYTYFCSSANDMADTFIAYTDYLEQYFEIDSIKTGSGYARYYFLDDLGRRFYVEWHYYNMGYYGVVNTIYVGFASEVGIAAAVKG